MMFSESWNQMALFEIERILEQLCKQAYPDLSSETQITDMLGCLCVDQQGKNNQYYDNKRECDQTDPLDSPEAFSLLNDLDALLDFSTRGIVDEPFLQRIVDSREQSSDEPEYTLKGMHLLQKTQ